MSLTQPHRIRQKINTQIDVHLLNALEYLSKDIDFPISRMVEHGLKQVLLKQELLIKTKAKRKKVNLTINPILWNELKQYAAATKYKLVTLLEAAIRYCLKHYKKKSYQLSPLKISPS